MKALVIAEHDNHILKGATRALVTAALQIAEHVDDKLWSISSDIKSMHD